MSIFFKTQWNEIASSTQTIATAVGNGSVNGNLNERISHTAVEE